MEEEQKKREMEKQRNRETEKQRNKRTEELKNRRTSKSDVALREERVLDFWKKNRIFEKSLEKPSPKGEFVFYDGPPFATGVPHYGHILPTTMKDVIPRYKTMKGYRVERIWGWDCHGLPIENIIERELGFKSKKEIEDYGIDKFNEKAEASVLRYADVWKDVIPRVGRWVDMERDYKTMDFKYTESIWWAFKTLYDKGLIYKGHKSMHICPRCETTLSNFEVTQGYKDVKDISVTVKFELLRDSASSLRNSAAKTYVLAWTTTPWTLIGNVALAVREDIDYVRIRFKTQARLKGDYILAKDRLGIIKDDYEIIEEFKGKDLVGKRYKPLFDYYSKREDLENRENGWKIYEAPFVTTEEGTGVVHIAPAFGADDMELGKQKNLPFVQHVLMDGKFKPEVEDFAGMSVKPKDDPQKTDVEILKHLAARDLVFSKEKIEHSYPHCWRCETPLLNYATSSWFVAVTKIKDDLLQNNKKTRWVPAHMRDGRFGKWLEGAIDWAISRSRYWGAALPVWQCEKCANTKVIGSLEELKKSIRKSGNSYFVMRHGQAENNAKEIVSSDIAHKHHLTARGREGVKKTAEELKEKNVDLIFASPFLRTAETAKIIADELGISKEEIFFDHRIGEINLGEFDLKPTEEYRAYFGYQICPSDDVYFCAQLDKMTKSPPGGESLYDVRRRVMNFLYDIESKYSNKNILIVTHEYPIWMLIAGSQGLNKEDSAKLKKRDEDFVEPGIAQELPFVPFPHDEDYELDLHRPYIDEVELECDCAPGSLTRGEVKRVEDVFDCWFESGSMPYAQLHYPFQNKRVFHKRFPADFIAEGVDQTRGWFYSLMVLSTALFREPTFKNVIVNGLILGEDGRKMSKRLGNYPELGFVLDQYGADALRFFLMTSPAVRGEEVALSERAIQEVKNKVINRLDNVVSFYELYVSSPGRTSLRRDRSGPLGQVLVSSEGMRPGDVESDNVLDAWIVARLNQTIAEIEAGLENYELDKASRPVGDFIEDLSTWYLRRSRSRFKSETWTDADFTQTNAEEQDRLAALATTRFVLLEFSKTIAPILPFIAEDVFQKIKGEDCKESVHLEKWPKTVSSIWYSVSRIFGRKSLEEKILADMKQVREIVEKALAARQEAGIRVRQPLQKLVVRSLVFAKAPAGRQELDAQYIQLIKDEVNVKEVVFDPNIKDEVELDTEITPELKQEGDFRELVRAVQDLRKKGNLTPSDSITLTIETNEKGRSLIEKFKDDFQKTVLAREIKFESAPGGSEIKIDSLLFKINIKQLEPSI